MVSASGILQSLGGSYRKDHYRAWLVFIYVATALVFAALGAYDAQRNVAAIEDLARERGRVLFSLVELTRDWNARHGGVYVPVSEHSQPNPYLQHPRRDLKTEDGQALTMINPAFMTRQISELAERQSGVRFRITSRKPIRPENAPDDWEAESLAAFETTGLSERIAFFEHEIFNGNVRPAHRYMAPLKVGEPCMRCHAQQGYAVGDIRGGISVTMPAEALLALKSERHARALSVLGACFVLVVAVLHAILARARKERQLLEAVAHDQENVIAERTRSLNLANDELARELADRRMREHELRLAAAVFESATEAIMVTDADNHVIRVNPAFSVITGYTQREVLGRNPRLLRSGRHDANFYAGMWSALRARGHWEGEIWNRHKSGEVRVEWLSITVIDDGLAGSGKYLAVFHDITRAKEAEEILRHKAYHDALTDLPNRQLFADRLAAALHQARRHQRSVAVLLIDLDHFKEVNDSLGHAAGDALLVEVADVLRHCVREADTVSRLGGDEFAILLAETGVEQEALDVATRVLAHVAEPFLLEAGRAAVSASIGVVRYPQDGETPELLMRHADIAMYAAKAAGRNCYRVFDAVTMATSHAGDPVVDATQGARET